MGVRPLEEKKLIVTTIEDVVNPYDGVISLREAILYANAGIRAADGTPTITFDSSLGNDIHIELDPALGNIELTSGLYEIETLKIQGLENVTIQNGSFEKGVFKVNSDNHVEINDIDFNANSATQGGAVYIEGHNCIMTLSNVTFSGNSARNEGGAVYNYGGGYSGVITITNAVFTNNTVVDGRAGAIVNDRSNMILSSATFSGNSGCVTYFL